MVGLVERRISKSAIWCRRLALFAVPYFAVSILLHRTGHITTDQVMGLVAFGFILLVLSIILAIRAMIQLWNEGAKGGKAMIVGLFLALLMLTPFLMAGITASQLPALNDVATNLSQVPQFSTKTIAQRMAQHVPAENDVTAQYSDEELTQIQVAYPKLSPRRYPAGSERVFQAVKALIIDRGWSITQITGLTKKAPTPKPGKKPKAKKPSKLKSKKIETENPDSGLEPVVIGDITIDAVASSFVFGFKNDVTILIVSEEDNTLVEMRSAARWGIHDFGANATLIEDFLRDLDQNLIGIAGEG